MKRLVPLILLFAATGCRRAPAAEDAAPEPVVSVEVVSPVKRDIRELVQVQGSFVVAQGGAAKLTSSAPGRVSKVLVKEGDIVHKGQLLASVDISVQAAQQSSALAAAQAAQTQAAQSQLSYQAAASDQAASVQTAQLALESAKLDRDTAVNQAQLAYDSAKADLDRTRAGARPQEVAQAEQAEVQARVAFDRASSDYQRAILLTKEGFMSQRDLESAKATRDTADSALKSAQAALSLVKAGARPEELRSAELHAAAALDALRSARALGARRIAQAETALRQAKQSVLGVAAKQKEAEASQQTARQKQADLASAAATASLGSIVAPYDGRITRRILNPGDFADTTTPVLELVGNGIRTDFLATAPVEQASKVKPGQDVEIGDAKGKVLSVSPADAQTGLSAIRIVGTFSQDVGKFSAANIVVSTDRQVIAVAKDALLDRDGKQIVFKVNGEEAKQAEVTVGPVEDGFIEIKKGVALGDKLVKVGQYELSDGTKIKVAEPTKEPNP